MSCTPTQVAVGATSSCVVTMLHDSIASNAQIAFSSTGTGTVTCTTPQTLASSTYAETVTGATAGVLVFKVTFAGDANSRPGHASDVVNVTQQRERARRE